MKKRFVTRIAAAILSITMAFGLCACGNSAKTATTDANHSTETESFVSETVAADQLTGEIDDEIHFAINGAPPTLDLQLITNVLGKMIGENYVYEKLVAYDQNYEVCPVLAESFEVSADNTEYTYHLRKGVMFHNGKEMTADDVVASMNRWIEKISAAKSLFGESRFEKVDDYTVKVVLSAPNIFVNDMIAGCNNYAAIYPESVIADADPNTGYVKDYIGTGPYKFVEWVADQYILLEKNADYITIENGAVGGYAAPKTAVTDKIYFEFVSDDATRVAGIQTGEYDIIYKAPYEDYDMLKNDSSLDIYNAVYGDIWLVFNKKAGLGTNAKFRQAIQMGINNDEILLGAYASEDFYRPDGSYMLREQATWYTDADDATYNVADTEGAKALLAEAGYNGETFTLLVSPDYSDMYNAALVIQSQLTALGVNCELLTADWATFTSYRSDESMYTAYITTGPAPVIPTTILYLSSGYAGWAADEKLQGMMKELNGAATVEDGVALWKEIQGYCSNEYVPICYLGNIYRYSVASDKLKNVGLFSYGPILWNAYVEK